MIEFIFPYRLHRLGYLLRLLVANAVLYYLYSCSTTTDAAVWWALIVVLTVYELIFIVLPRIRDIGLNGLWLLIVFVPVVGAIFSIILLFRAPVLLPNQLKFKPEPI